MQVAIPFWQYSAVAPATLNATLSKMAVAGYGFYSPPPPAATVFTDTVTCIASGGTPPYTYAWARDSGAAESNIHCFNKVVATTKFWEQQNVTYSYDADWKCTVTDALMATATTGTVAVHIEQNT